MRRYASLPALAVVGLLSLSNPVLAQGDMGAATEAGNIQSLASAFPSGPDHGMPEGTAGGDGAIYSGAPDLGLAISLVTAGGTPGNFSIVQALTTMAGAKTANAEVGKLTKEYGSKRVNSYVLVQNFAVNDAVSHATAAGITFPKPTLTGAALAKQVVTVGLLNDTYYEGYMLDHVVSNKIHDVVMGDIDAKYGTVADANYHLISDQAHYDLAQALGVTSVKLAAYH